MLQAFSQADTGSGDAFPFSSRLNARTACPRYCAKAVGRQNCSPAA